MQTINASQRATCIDIDSIIGVIRISTQHQYNARELDITNATIESNVTNLFAQDFDCQVIANTNGELSLYYPRRILLPTVNKWSNEQKSKLSNVDIREQFVRSRIARCRSRFVVPAILIDGKYICRSSTVASWGEVYPRTGADLFLDTGNRASIMTMPIYSSASAAPNPVDFDASTTAPAPLPSTEPSQQKNIFDKLRGADIELMKSLDVTSIVNLMVEKKKSKFGVNITSSENSDKENRYRDFDLLILPYPGCEHFREFSLQNYNGELMFYDWTLPINDASFSVPESLSSMVPTDWSFWKSWNSVELTKNYFRLILRHLEINDHGLLIHCISGWDRTPLFMSLLRVSLWADGWIHQSLTVEEMLYFTLAYDWYLFGHCLPDRLSRGEEILYFAFMILPYLIADEFSYKNSQNPPLPSSDAITDRVNNIYSVSALPHLNRSNSPSPVHINEDASVSLQSQSNEDISLTSATDVLSNGRSEIHTWKPKTIREKKLIELSHVFQICYRTVIPNPPPSISANAKLFPQAFGSLNPRPMVREIARSINSFLGTWRTAPPQ